jgi:two-component system response regulator YesN
VNYGGIEMWKTVIIDDERRVLNGMRNSIPWKELGAEWIGEGMDGKQGLELIRKTQPDIVLTDIYMPVMSGLDMIAQLRLENYQGKIIIISGYSDFQYARQALRLKVDDYLSKPVTIQTMKEVLQRVILHMEEESKQHLENSTEKALYAIALKQLNSSSDSNLFEYDEVIKTGKSTADERKLVGHIKFCQQIVEALQHQQINQVNDRITDYSNQLRETSFSSSDLFLLGTEIWGILSYSLYEVGIFLDEMFPDMDLHQELGKIKSPVQLMEWLTVKVAAICDNRQWNDNLKHKQAVDFTIQYIYEHYADNITLFDISNKLYISRYYLGQIFRKATGETFNQYLTKVRMTKAKAMILEGKLLVYEIADKVGISNVAYFSTLFKKHTGLNHTELLK